MEEYLFEYELAFIFFTIIKPFLLNYDIFVVLVRYRFT